MSAPGCWAVLAAAGSGSRFGGALPKQYATLAGKTVLEHSLSALCAMPEIRGVALVVAENDQIWPELNLAVDPRVQIVTGGAERADSVLNGLRALAQHADENDWALVHDAARPCVRPADMSALLNELADDKVGGLWALPMVDTIKQARDGQVLETIPRETLWRAQTPQVFRFGLLVGALADMAASGEQVTDESAAVERQGHKPKLVVGSRRNLKITQQEDLELAAFYLQQMEVQ